MIKPGIKLKLLALLTLCPALFFHTAKPHDSVVFTELDESSSSASGHWTETHILTKDAYLLPYRSWHPPEREPDAIVLGLHGLNDYSAGLTKLAKYLAENHRVATYTYDQRGFGANLDRGQWAGEKQLISDAQFVSHLLAERYPDKPLFIVGHSIGGDIAIRLVVDQQPEHVDGLVLIAPAVWGRDEMPWYQRSGLWIATHLIPKLELSSEWVGAKPTDNPRELYKWRTDPLVQSNVKAGHLGKITALMSSALEATEELHLPTLILYGKKDEIVPEEPICAMLERLPDPPAGQWRFALYPQGHHLLTRDLQRHLVLEDIGAWISAGHDEEALPSNQETERQQAIQTLCR